MSDSKITEINYVDIVKKHFANIMANPPVYYDYMLPLLFTLHGTPLTLENHIQMRSLFASVLPAEITYKTGRQVSKSMSNAIQSIMFAFANPYHNILHLAPLYQHIERFSSDYVAPLIYESPFREAFVSTSSKKAILQRSFKNGSNLIFTFAFHDCTRVRGITANVVKYDEYQSMDISFEPIINQTLAAAELRSKLNNDSGNKPGIMRFGTPLTFDNGLEQQWALSSQAEWGIPCPKCRKLNIPSLREDLEGMMGSKHRKEPVSREAPGIVCAKCGSYLNTRDGHWVHQFPERADTHAGYHLPQCVMTFHCESDSQWKRLQQYRFNRNIISESQFYNEVCGESYDHGQKLISVTDLRAAAVLPKKSDQATHLSWIASGKYKDWGVGVDWGGGGVKGISKTAFAVAGIRTDGIIEVFTGHRSNIPNDFNLEASRTVDIRNVYSCKFVSMDFNGSGGLRRNKLLEHGIPANMLIPMEYVNIGQGAIARLAEVDSSRMIPARIQVNKARSLLVLSTLIRSGRIRFFEYDYKSPEEPGLLNDFTALAEEYVEMMSVGNVHRVIHVPEFGPDDFAQAVNYVVCALYIRNGGYPDAGSILTVHDLSPDQQRALEPKFRDSNFSWFHENQ